MGTMTNLKPIRFLRQGFALSEPIEAQTMIQNSDHIKSDANKLQPRIG